MSDVLSEAEELVQCRSCPWYKACVLPMRFTEEDIKRQLQSSMPGLPQMSGSDTGMQQVLAGMAAAAQSSLLEGCPVFVNRLRQNPSLAQRIKKLMTEWSAEREMNSDQPI